MTFFIKYKTPLLLGLILIGGAIVRLYDLNWGAPYYFHPDERNIASAISQLTFPTNLNPHFFAYGAFPIYTAFGIGLLSHAFTMFTGVPFINSISFEQAILILRSLSSLLSLLCLPVMYFLGKKLQSTTTGLLATFLGATSIGLIQFAHFGTFELWLTFLSLLMFLTHLLYWQTGRTYYRIFQVVLFTLLVATKISSLALLPLLFLLPPLFEKISLWKKALFLLRQGLLIMPLTLIVFLVTNPFSLLDLTSFLGSISYESGVATGRLMVFYTGEFVGTTTVLYHLLNVYPFLLNPLVFVLFLPAFCYALYQGFHKKRPELLLLCLYTLVLFFSQAFLFVKWTRYLVPTLPFIYLLIAFFFTDSLSSLQSSIKRLSLSLGLVVVGIVSIIFASAFFITVYIHPDTRIDAARWAQKHLAKDSYVLSEVYDLGIIPFNEQFSDITLFNFYDLDNNSPEFTNETLQDALAAHDVLILPSQRIVKSRLLYPRTFPEGAAFYSSLFQGETAFTTLYTTPCDMWCQITYWGDPVFAFEGTSNIFDRPTVFIFGKESEQQ